MQAIKSTDTEARLNAHELCTDYKAKLNTACELALVHHEQDEHGATLVIHVPARGIEAEQAKAKLGERLGKLIADFPAPAAETETTIVEDQKAVVDTSKTAKKSTKAEKPNDKAASTGS